MMVCEQGPAYTQRRGAPPGPPRPGSASTEGHPNPHTALQLPRWLLCEPGLEVSRNGPRSQPAVPGRGWTWSLAWPVCASPVGFSQGSRLLLSVPTGPDLFPSPALAHSSMSQPEPCGGTHPFLHPGPAPLSTGSSLAGTFLAALPLLPEARGPAAIEGKAGVLGFGDARLRQDTGGDKAVRHVALGSSGLSRTLRLGGGEPAAPSLAGERRH